MNTTQAIKHLGGNGLFVMIGGSATVSESTLTVRFKARAKDGIKAFRLTLEDDLYKVEFIKVRKFDHTVVDTVDGLFAEDLKRTVEKRLGLYLSL